MKQSEEYKSILKIFRNQSGMAALGWTIVVGVVLTALTTGTMNYVENQRKEAKKVERRVDEHDLVNEIKATLADVYACNNTLGTVSFGTNFNNIRGRDNAVIFSQGMRIGRGAGLMEISSFKLDTVGTPDTDGTLSVYRISINLDRVSGTKVVGSVVKYLTIVGTTASATGPLTNCYADSQRTVIVSEQLACDAIGGVWVTDEEWCKLYDDEGESPTVTAAGGIAVNKQYVDRESCTALGLRYNTTTKACDVNAVCASGEYLYGIKIQQSGGDYFYTYSCAPMLRDCSANGMVLRGISATGTPICTGGNDSALPASCPAGEFAVLTSSGLRCSQGCAPVDGRVTGTDGLAPVRALEINSVGVPVCISCSDGQVAMHVNGDYTCMDAMCPQLTGVGDKFWSPNPDDLIFQFVYGFDSSGLKCSDELFGAYEQCAVGQSFKVDFVIDGGKRYFKAGCE